MTIHLKPEVEKLIQEHVQSGSYQSADEYVEQAVRALHEEEEWLAQAKGELNSKIAAGLTQLDHDERVLPKDAREQLRLRKASPTGR